MYEEPLPYVDDVGAISQVLQNSADLLFYIKTTVIVVKRRLGSASKLRNANEGFNLEAPFSRMEHWERYRGSKWANDPKFWKSLNYQSSKCLLHRYCTCGRSAGSDKYGVGRWCSLWLTWNSTRRLLELAGEIIYTGILLLYVWILLELWKFYAMLFCRGIRFGC